MCGISGIATARAGQPVSRPLLEAMTDVLEHRGPDGRGFHCAPGIGLGMRRLSIVDLETGDQPIANEDGTIQLVCNGEIYNAPELREELLARGHRLQGQSDVEVIVHLYEEMGMRCLDRLRGMFAIALWDGNSRTLQLARDRFGIKPLYYGQGTDGTLYFGSEAKSVLLSGAVDCTLDPVGLTDVMTLAGPLFTRTLFKGVQQLESGHRLTFTEGRLTVHQYWDLEFDSLPANALPKSEGEWAEALASKLREATRLHLRGDVPVAGYLSAGIDSSAVVTFAAEALGRVPTFSLGFREADLDELRHQRLLDEYPEYAIDGERLDFGESFLPELPHTIWHQEQPFVLQPSYRALGAALQGRYKVALTGQGSDEMLGGYPWYDTDRMWRPLYGFPAPVRSGIARILPRITERDARAITSNPAMSLDRFVALQYTMFAEMRTLFSPDLAREHENAQRSLAMPALPEAFSRWDRFQRMQYVEAKTRLPSFINRGLDSSNMSRSIEPRLPFLDHEFAELCLHIPPALRARRMEKHVLRMAMDPYLPSEITWRKKRGMRSPEPRWKKRAGPPPAFATALLSDEAIRAKGYFCPEAVRALREKHAGLPGPLVSALGVQLLDEQFVQGAGRPA